MAIEYHLTGTVVDGGLRLDAPVPLPDGIRVHVTIIPLEERGKRSVTETQPHAPAERSIQRADETQGNPTDSLL